MANYLFTVDFTREPGQDKGITFGDDSFMPLTDPQFQVLHNSYHLTPVLKMDDNSVFCTDNTPQEAYGPYKVTVDGKVKRYEEGE